MEIPKDGLAYLAWHPRCGIVIVTWFKEEGTYSGYYDIKCHSVAGYSGMGRPNNDTSLEKCTRWMDSEGIWHKVDDGNT